MIRLIAPHTPAESYQNFPNRGIDDWQQQYYAENYAPSGPGQDQVRPAQSVPQRAEHPRAAARTSGRLTCVRYERPSCGSLVNLWPDSSRPAST